MTYIIQQHQCFGLRWYTVFLKPVTRNFEATNLAKGQYLNTPHHIIAVPIILSSFYVLCAFMRPMITIGSKIGQ